VNVLKGRRKNSLRSYVLVTAFVRRTFVRFARYGWPAGGVSERLEAEKTSVRRLLL
jgi:hypothetical protein